MAVAAMSTSAPAFFKNWRSGSSCVSARTPERSSEGSSNLRDYLNSEGGRTEPVMDDRQSQEEEPGRCHGMNTGTRNSSSRKQAVNQLSGDDGGPFGAPVVHIGQLHVVQSEEIKDGGMDIVHVHRLLYGAKADFVGRSNIPATFNPAAGHPDGEAPGIMVSTIATLVERR